MFSDVFCMYSTWLLLLSIRRKRNKFETSQAVCDRSLEKSHLSAISLVFLSNQSLDTNLSVNVYVY